MGLSDGAGGAPRRHWEVAIVVVLALVARLANLDVVHAFDDYFQFLAAESLLSDGTTMTGDGRPYDRALLWTYVVAGFMYLFGETTYAARLPAVLAGAGLVALLFVWLRSEVGRVAAWIAALLLAFDPGAIAVSQFIRFYALHSLMFVAAAIGVYLLVTRPSSRPRSIVLFLGAILALALAYHLQLTTVIGTLALFGWLVVDLAPRVVRVAGRHPRAAMAWSLAGVGGLLVACLLLLHMGIVGQYWAWFRRVPVWGVEHGNELGYYMRRLRRDYPLLWWLFPVAVVLSVARHGRPAIFCAVLFAVPLVLHSLAGGKAERYLSYAMPFFFATWGMATSAILPALHQAARRAISRVLGQPALRPSIPRPVGWALSALLIVTAGLMNPAFSHAYHWVHPGAAVPNRMSQPDWRGAAAELRDLVDSSDVIVASGGGHALYQLGRLDVLVGSAHGWDSEYREWGVDPQLGRVAITLPQSLASLMECRRSGLVLVEENHLGRNWAANQELVDFLERHLDPILLPESLKVRAFAWRGDTTRASPSGSAEGCPPIPGLSWE